MVIDVRDTGESTFDDLRSTIGNDEISADIDATSGGRIAQIVVRDVELLIGRETAGGDPLRWGSYPMVPWAGRIRHGRFTFGGAAHQLPVEADGHAIHGVGFVSPWAIDTCTTASIELSLQLPSDGSWPFGGHARQRITVGADQIVLGLEVTAGDVAFPALIGWHPWFRKPDRIAFHPRAMYRRVDGVAVDELVEVPPSRRSGQWDDCFVNTEPIVLAIDGITVRLSSDCTDWVVFDERPEATCVEPQSGPPDAFNIRPHVLAPGDTLGRSYHLRFDS